MYGRNELIARYIKLRTGKTRTRKQVSSHIQVLARRKSRELHSQFKTPRGNEGEPWPPYKPQINNMDQATKDKVLQSMASMSSAQIVSAGVIPNNPSLLSGIRPQYQKPHFWPGVAAHSEVPDIKPFRTDAYAIAQQVNSVAQVSLGGQNNINTNSNALMALGGYGPHIANQGPPWQGRQIATHMLRLVDFSAFLEQQHDADNYSKHLFVHINHSNPSHSDPLLESIDIRQIYDKFPEKKSGLRELYEKGPKESFFLVKFWADLNVNIVEDSNAFYGVTSQFESTDDMTISCSTKVCSFGKQVVEKVETEYARFENGRYVYRIHRSPMCEYMINFILKLKHLPETYMMNSVLENFTILQVVSNRDTNETLLCMAYVFEVSTSEHGAQHHIYQLVGDTKQ
ncbi:transcriptional enhancer factor TEF-1-like isoform X2 [Styela clava]|uniref:transcriptional enhancer factor TEF-1-like isoform X1 n=1 Tax=Styela clava TaxID=7725 RepID=UPI00193A6F77|nr:transcriptional enhancer factor TEF-1-like isoform X1 [Styela clava]